ncbi:phosphopantetheine-binding protein [Streptomyces sp. WZ.A104]|uniref:phosphopantetheine-binding protein n=1 Tax=Streptomyces sp. WZ.A104 TaxID=2023771 RepID=UPI000BBC1E4B|nr:phosphopantetheine-binding protein [Streptomyces sp. WZ.A104]PCG84207.1 phosphopantetheine-binding protein [Streptomyces sp. WZ.A104]
MTHSSPDTAHPEELEELLRPLLPLLPPTEPIRPDLDLQAAGLDSLGTVELLTGVEDHFGIEVPEEMLTFELFSTPSALWDAVRTLRSHADGRSRS